MLTAHPTMRSGTLLVVPSHPYLSRPLSQRRQGLQTVAKPFDPMCLGPATVAKSFSSAVIGASSVDQLPVFQWLSYAVAAYAAYQLAQVQDEVRV